MRVVFLTHNYPRWPGDSSGAPLALLARALLGRGIAVRVLAPGEESTGKFELDGVPVHRVKIASSLNARIQAQDASPDGSSMGWSALLRLWRALRSAARRETSSGTDIVHAHSWTPAGLAAPAGVPLVLTLHHADASLLRRSRIARALARPVLQRAAVVTAVSREVGNWVQTLTGRFVDAAHIHPLPVDTRAHPWTRGGGGGLVLGRLAAAGRVELALETAAVLASCGHELPLTIIGDGPGRAALEQKAAKLGVSELVRFVGEVRPEQIRGYLERADLVLVTARGEGTAVGALEALISGVPVIACWDGGAAVDIVPETGAGRLSLPSPESLADSVLDLQADRDRFTMARLVGEAWRARLAPGHVAELYEGWYRNAVAR